MLRVGILGCGTIAAKVADSLKGSKKVRIEGVGIKNNIARELAKRSCEVHLLPADTDSAKVMELAPDGIFLSNGPGDPEDNTKAIETMKVLKD